MKILITGASGNVGSGITEVLSAEHQIRLSDMMTIIEKYQFKLPSRIQVMDLSKEREELGYQPIYNFGTFIKEFTKEGEITE
jgi:nucleoside-diphosphate-sugar epimerase